MNFTLGITDKPSQDWDDSMEWEERHDVTTDHTFADMVSELCDSSIRARRGSDCGYHAHIWSLKVFKDQKKAQGRKEYFLVMPEKHWPGDDEVAIDILIAERVDLDPIILFKGKVLELTYDHTHPTTLFLKVLTCIAAGGPGEDLNSWEEKDLRDLEAIPAFHLPEDKRIDASFPSFSKAFIGDFVPLLEDTVENADLNYMIRASCGGFPIGPSTWGLSARFNEDTNIIFSTIEDSTMTGDLFLAPAPFQDINEFLIVAESAWKPRDPRNDPDRIWEYRYDWLSRFVFPAGSDGDLAHTSYIAESKLEIQQFGMKMLFFRLGAKKQTPPPFDFAEVFPKTHAHFQSGLFRWIRYENGVLSVLVGRGTGDDNRRFKPRQVLRQWTHKFESLHDLLCAVEASWVHKGEPLEADTRLREFDSDNGPSDPMARRAGRSSSECSVM